MGSNDLYQHDSRNLQLNKYLFSLLVQKDFTFLLILLFLFFENTNIP